MERLTPLATAFLDAEDDDPRASLVIGSMTVFAGPAPDFEEFLAAVAGRLVLIPRYRQRLMRLPFDLAAPAWVDDADFDLRWHVRNTAVPSPGGRAEVGRLMGRVMSQRMDRDRPLWEYWFVEGLEGGRWGLISKLHHCMADGVSGTDLYRLLFDLGPEPGGPVPDTWEPERPPSTLGFAARGVWDLAGSQVAGVRALAGALRRSPGELARRTATTARGVVALSGAIRPTTSSSLLGPIGLSRRYTWTTASLEDFRVVRGRFGGTVNDVALAAVSGGFRRLLLARGEEPSPHTLRSLVPVSTRPQGTEHIPGNQVSLLLPFLPVEIADPADRLAAVRDRIAAHRSAHEPEAGQSISTAAEYGPFPGVSMGIRLALRAPQRSISTVTTNVPGPPMTLYALGREVEDLLPYVPIANRVRIGVAIHSYRGTLAFGVTGDYETVPDIEVLAEGIAASMAELVEAARAH